MQIVKKSLTSPKTSLCVVVSIAGIVYGAAAEWPQFRGPELNDHSPDTGLLQDWSEGGPHLAWKVAGLGAGYSGVSVAGERIFTAGDKGNSTFVTAWNHVDGKPLWSARLGKSDAPGDPKFEGPRSTPTVSGDLVFVLGQWGDLVCLEAATGKEVWRKSLVQDFGGAYPGWGYAESPLVDGDKVVVTPGGSQGAIVALNQKTGNVIWRSKEFTDPAHYSSLIVEEIGGVRQYIQLTAESVAGIAASDGKLLWRSPRKGNVAVISSTVYKDGYVFVSSSYGTGCNLFKVTAEGGKFSAEQVYANKIMSNHHGGVVNVGDCIYGYSDGKGWTCQDLKTGKALWEEKEKLAKGSLVYADQRLYLRQEGGKGTVALIEASPEGYKEHGRFDQPDRTSKNSWPHPVVIGGKLYLRDQDALLCYDVKAK